MKRVQLRITGVVQGVAFRMYTEQTAISLGLTGWVRNRFDGSVEAVAEGTEEKLRDFIEWCHKGPPAARVASVEKNYSEATGEFAGFSILPTA